MIQLKSFLNAVMIIMIFSSIISLTITHTENYKAYIGILGAVGLIKLATCIKTL